MALADVVHEERKPSALIYTEENLSTFAHELDKLEDKAVESLLEQRIPKARIASERYLNMRFHGSDTPMMIQQAATTDFLASFEEAHQKQFGFLPVGREVIVDDYRVRSIGSSGIDLPTPWPVELASVKQFITIKPDIHKDVYFTELGWCKTPVYDLNGLQTGSKVLGPALIMDDKQTIIVIPNATATVLLDTIVIDVKVGNKSTLSSTKVDPIQLSIFGHRFMSVAEQMGRALQKTSVSTNIKERLDFSCTVFSPDGGLVANAPHVPAMVCLQDQKHTYSKLIDPQIGSMAFAVKWQIEHWGANLNPGDVILSNSPSMQLSPEYIIHKLGR